MMGIHDAVTEYLRLLALVGATREGGEQVGEAVQQGFDEVLVAAESDASVLGHHLAAACRTSMALLDELGRQTDDDPG